MEKEQKTITAYILGDGQVLTADELARSGKLVPKMKGAANEIAAKSAQFSAVAFPGAAAGTRVSMTDKIVEPPYEPTLLAKFLEADEIHFRCCRTKTTDSLCRGHMIGDLNPTDNVTHKSKVMRDEIDLIKKFMANCNQVDKFKGVLEKAGMDHESIGWGAIEVIRSADRRIRKLNHVPADRLRALSGWEGFAEVGNDGKATFYQPYGVKVVSTTRRLANGEYEPFDIVEDTDWSNSQWNLRDRETFEPIGPTELSIACNEILYIPKFHPKSVYYGLPDFIPAVGHILANINIRDFLLQYFDHNTVPQYAVIIKGADLDAGTKSLITSFFNQHVKGSSHKTLVIPIPGMAGDIDVQFQRLENVANIAAYEGTRKANQTAIMVAHGVNPAIIGISEAGELGSGKGTAQMENYNERIVRPSQERWSTHINDLLRTGLGVQFAGVIFDSLATESDDALLNRDMKAMEKGLLTLNEVKKRNRLGDPVEGGDRAFLMTGAGPVFVDQLIAPKEGEQVTQLGDQLEKLGQMTDMGENDIESSHVTQLVP